MWPTGMSQKLVHVSEIAPPNADFDLPSLQPITFASNNFILYFGSGRNYAIIMGFARVDMLGNWGFKGIGVIKNA